MKPKSKKSGRAISMALAAAMTIAPVNAFAASSDVRGHWAEKTITEWQDKGLISGYQDGTFKPNKPTTRAEFARIMNQALGLNSKGNVAFSDVSVNDWFYNDIAIALGEAYTAGYPDGTFKPNETITRAQAAVFIAKAIEANGGSVIYFTDSASIPAWAKDSIGAVVEKGYMSGYPDGTFKPNAVLTRAEAVSTLNRIMGAADEEETTTVTNKDVVIDVDDTKLENQTIAGNVIISEKVGDGEVYLNNVVIEGDLIVQGGGDDSIYVDNSTVEGKTVVDKKNVRFQVSGKTKLSKVQIKKACNFNARNFTGEIKTITLAADISDRTTIGVPADTLYIDEKANLLIKKEIGQIIIDEAAEGTKLEVEKGAKVSILIADGKVVLSGSGKIFKLEANTSGITYSSGLTISKTETASGEKAPTPITTTGGGSDSSSTDTSSSKKNITGIAAITGTAKVGVELTAGALTPSGAVGSYQWMTSDTADGTYANIAGATTNKYKPVIGDVGKYIKVRVTGTGNYKGTVTSTATTAVVGNPLLVTASTIANGAVNPTVVVTLTNDTFTAAGVSDEITNWIGNVGTTGLIAGTITRNSDTQITFQLTGTAKPGTLTLQAKAAALTSGVASNIITVVIPASAQTGAPVLSAGTPAKFNTGLGVANGTLGITTNLTYTWYRSDDNAFNEGTDTQVGTGVNYTPVADDIGKYLIVVVTTPDATGNGTVATKDVVAKADGPVAPAAPTLGSKTSTSVVLTAIVGAEYKVGDGTWQDSPEFTGLTPNTAYEFKARIKETTTHQASLESALTTITTEVATVPVPGLANGLSFTDDDANDDKTVINLGAPSVVGNTFVYKISDDANAVATPNVGDDLSAWTAVTNGESIIAANGKHIGVAEVDGSNKAVQFSDAMAVTQAEPLLPSTPPSPADVIVTNNNSGDDTVVVSNLVEGDVVKVYNASTGGILIGTSTAVGSSETSATVSIVQLGTGAGSVYVTVTNAGKAESTPRTEIAYDAEAAEVTITGYFLDNGGLDTPLVKTATVANGTDEATAKAGLSTTGYAKLSDNSYVPITITWTFDEAYVGTVAGAKAVTGAVTGTFAGGQTPVNQTGTVTVEAEEVTITGYFLDNGGLDTPLVKAATVANGTDEATAKAGLSTTGYAKLSDNSYVPITISWTFDEAYVGTVAGAKAVTGTVTGTFAGGQTPVNQTGTVTVEAEEITITGYFLDNGGLDTPLVKTATVANGTDEANAKAGLSTTGYAKLSDNSYVPITISWTFDEAYVGTIAGAKAVTGTVTGTFAGGQTPVNQTGTVTVEAEEITITGYFLDNGGLDTPLVKTATVANGTDEANAKAGLSTTGYAKLSDNSYVPITISWTFDEAYVGTVAGAKAVTGTVTGTFAGGQTPVNQTGTVTVEAVAAPVNLAAGVTFIDTDTHANKIAGNVVITKAADESDVDNYVVYYLDASDGKVGPLIGTVAKTADPLQVVIAADTSIPVGATQIGVYSLNAGGESATATKIALTDNNSYVPSSSAALDLTAETGTKLAGVVLTDDHTGGTGTSVDVGIQLSVTISVANATAAVFEPVTENATVTAYADLGESSGSGTYLPVASNYSLQPNSILWIKVVSEDGSKTLYYNLLVTIA